ncbi:membrane-bound lytic murein transglycosylase MltF [Algiphilus sp.]|uniref:membrane-bound lytic murein transglycosylase MltF n=1 Tax=Algiphilus sp. TaxID=1872431 RepID=UPI003B522582
MQRAQFRMRRERSLLLLAVGLLAGCGQAVPPASEPPSETQPLVVVTRNAPTSYRLDRRGLPAGPEVGLVRAFAEAQGVPLRWLVKDSTDAVLRALDRGEAHLAAAGLTRTVGRDQRFRVTAPYRAVREVLVCQRHHLRLSSLDALPADTVLRVAAGTSYVDTLQRMKAAGVVTDFKVVQRRSTEALLREIDEKGGFCTLADSTIVALIRRTLPHLDVVTEVGKPKQLVWYAAQAFEDVAASAREWLGSADGRAAIDHMEYRYYAYIPDFDFVDLRALNRRVETRLPRFKPLFLKAAQKTQLAPDLLAALSYQESHWDPDARSRTGVRGMMMLTERTAEYLGVDRLDPTQAIEGGARYLAEQRDRLPAHIPEPDRSYLALAAYNLGRAHLLDARSLARRLGRNPDSWADMREVLPLLTEERYYQQLKFGYARGYQPVYYVQRIRNYRDVIRHHF